MWKSRNATVISRFHYGKNSRCRAALHCRASTHGKAIFAVRPSSRHTAKKQRTTKTSNDAWQRHPAAKDKKQRTAKIGRTAKIEQGARQTNDGRQSQENTHGKESTHGKEPLPCAKNGRTAKQPLPCVLWHFLLFLYYCT